MGCSNTRESKVFSSLSKECDDLMEKNLEMFTILEYLFIKSHNSKAALSILLARKKTKEFYDIIIRYRQFWIAKAKKADQDTSSTEEVSKCENEQNKEKSELLCSFIVLKKNLDRMYPNWSKEFENPSKLKVSLEQTPEIVLSSTSLHENFYNSDQTTIKKAIHNFPIPLDETSMQIIKSVKDATVKVYKNPEKRVYFTKEILIVEKVKEEKIETQYVSEAPKEKYEAEAEESEEKIEFVYEIQEEQQRTSKSPEENWRNSENIKQEIESNERFSRISKPTSQKYESPGGSENDPVSSQNSESDSEEFVGRISQK